MSTIFYFTMGIIFIWGTFFLGGVTKDQINSFINSLKLYKKLKKVKVPYTWKEGDNLIIIKEEYENLDLYKISNWRNFESFIEDIGRITIESISFDRNYIIARPIHSKELFKLSVEKCLNLDNIDAEKREKIMTQKSLEEEVEQTNQIKKEIGLWVQN